MKRRKFNAAAAAVLIFNFYAHGRTLLTIDAISRVRAMTSAVDRDIATTQANILSAGLPSPLAERLSLGRVWTIFTRRSYAVCRS